jgi:hypothetical protein
MMTRYALISILTYYTLFLPKCQPYPGFDPDEQHNYVFVPLPTLRRHYIFRQMMDFEDEGEGEGENDGESEERGAGSGEWRRVR